MMRDIWENFKENYRSYIGFGLLFALFNFIILAPITSFILNIFLSTTKTGVVSNFDLLSFFLSPIGVVTLVFIGSVFIMTAFFNVAGSMIISTGQILKRPVSIFGVLTFLIGRIVPLLKLGIAIVMSVLALLAPLALTIAYAFNKYLSEYDIYFYTSTRPPELRMAVMTILPVLILTVIACVYVYIRYTFVLPLVTFEEDDPIAAIKKSFHMSKEHKGKILRLILLWLLTFVLIIPAVFGIVFIVTGSIVEIASVNINILLTVLGISFLINTAIAWVVSILIASSYGILISELYLGVHQKSDLPRIKKSLPKSSLNTIETPLRSVTRRQFTYGIVGLVLLAGAIPLVFLYTSPPAELPTITAHRGSSLRAPENTMAAFELAMEEGSDIVELDVQETEDGVVVVIHDGDLRRVAGDSRSIYEVTYAELQDIDVGSWFDPEYADERVPSLEDALLLMKGKAITNIELKYNGENDDMAQKVVDIVEELDMVDEVIIMSLDERVLTIRDMNPDLEIGFTTSASLGNVTNIDADFFAVSTAIATEKFVSDVHTVEKDVHVWTVNDEPTMLSMILRGVDSIITDDPALLKDVSEEFEELSEVEVLLLQYAERWN